MLREFAPFFGLGFLLSAIIALCTIGLSRVFPFLNDHVEGVQKLHSGRIPRVGGLSIFLGFFLCFYFSQHQLKLDNWVLLKTLLACSLPAFLGGFLEDVTKQISPLARFVLTVASAIAAYFAVGASISFLDNPWVDVVLEYKLVALTVTGLAVAGVANGTNMLDGLNGLMLLYSITAFLSFALFSWLLGDSFFFVLNLGLANACLGVFFFNWPVGRIFMGDGGSYFLGFMLAENCILLYLRHPTAITPVALGVVLSFPVMETLFSIARRGIHMFEADDQHLHQLIFRNLKKQGVTNPNPWVTFCLWPLYSLPMFLGLASIHSSLGAFTGFFLFLGIYLVLYRQLKNTLS